MGKRAPHAAATYHHMFQEIIREYSEPTHLATEVIVEKLRKLGIEAEEHFDHIKQAVAQNLAANNGSGSAKAEFKIPGIADDQNIDLQFDDSDFAYATQRLEQSISRLSTEMCAGFTEDALREVLRFPDRRLLDLANERDSFNRRLELTWAEPFKLLDIHLAICREVGEARNHYLRAKRRRAKDLVVVDVLTRLQGRSLMVAEEAQALLRNGYADGAMSRWRTLHELAVTSMFILQHGVDVATRYAAHLQVELIKSAKQYQRSAVALGRKPISEKEMRRFDALKVSLVAQYGKPFLEDNGWAADVLKNARPSFASIEEAVDLDSLRPQFKLACGAVHAGAKGTFQSLGLVGDQDIILAGASNAGLDEAGRLVALSLTQCTLALLLLHVNIDSTVWAGVLNKLTVKIGKKFTSVQRRIERHERQSQMG